MPIVVLNQTALTGVRVLKGEMSVRIQNGAPQHLGWVVEESFRSLRCALNFFAYDKRSDGICK